MGTLPPLSMPRGGEFSSLFPPILDFQTETAITGKATAERAGHAPPSFSVPDLETPAPSFVLRDLDGDDDSGGRILGALGRPGSEAPQSPEHGAVDVDIWLRAAEEQAGPSRSAFQLRDWEAPEIFSPCRPSAVPSLAFESLTVQHDPPIELPLLSSPITVPPADSVALLDHLVRTTMTAPPPGLRWSRSKAAFAFDAKRVDKSAAGFINETLAIATAMRRIEVIVDEDGSALTSTHHAFIHALSNVLEYMKQCLTDMDGTTARQATPWLTRSLALEHVALLGESMCQVICWPLSEPKPMGLPARPSSMLTHLHNQLLHHLQTHIPSRLHITLCLAYLLQNTSQTWLDILHQWIGVADSSRADEDLSPISQPWVDLGITRTPLPPVNGEVRWEYTFAPRRMPVFIPPDMRRTFFEAGRSLRSLREASGGLHPLCWTDWPIKASWGWGAPDAQPEYNLRFHAQHVQREIDRWRTSTMISQPRSLAMSVSSMRSGRRQRELSRPTSPQMLTGRQSPEEPHLGTDVWLAAAEPVPPPGLFKIASDPTTAALWTPTPDALEAFIARHSDPSHPLLPRDSPTLEGYITQHLLAPPLAHATLISRALVSHCLDDLHFIDHLDVLHAFWLGGDAGFTKRVSAALFRDDYGSEDIGLGRRARTRARLGIANPEPNSNPGSMIRTPAPSVLETPSVNASTESESTSLEEQGIGLGVGLSDRKRWPPGGAELAYALRTTLFDHDIELFTSRGPVWSGIEDRVSFALRALPDENDERRAKWLNPQGIEALDFLYLAYSPPSSVAPLLPSSIMDKYHAVHNLLLRLSRVEAVLRGLYFDILRPDATGAKCSKTGVDAHHSRPASRINQPTVRAPVLGVFPSPSETAKTLQYLRFLMSWFVTAFSRYVLDTVGHNSDVMNRRLKSLQRGAIATTPSRESSRPSTPAWMIFEDDALELEMSDAESIGADDSQAQLEAISQLESAHSLVLYHHIILNRILRASLLSPGSATALGALTTLLELVLDFGKVAKDISRGAMTPDLGKETIRAMRTRWEEGYDQFIKAIERLARTRERADSEEDAEGTGDERDLQILLGEGSGRRTDIRELLLRLRLGTSRIVARMATEKGDNGTGNEEQMAKPIVAAETETPERAETKLEVEMDTEVDPKQATTGDQSEEQQEMAHVATEGTEGLPVPTTPEAEVEVELAEDLVVIPSPVVHSPLRPSRPSAPNTPLGKLPSLFRPQQGSERHRSDDEISID